MNEIHRDSDSESNDRVSGINRRPAVRRSWVSTRSLPSAQQLAVRPTKILVRGLFGGCPACGAHGNFKRWFQMSDRCRSCTLKFERVEGHWIGFLGTNTVLITTLLFVVMLSVTLISYPDPAGPWLIWTLFGIAVLGPIILYKTARMLWTAIDLLMRPLNAGEIDPRYVVVDPHRDSPTHPKR